MRFVLSEAWNHFLVENNLSNEMEAATKDYTETNELRRIYSRESQRNKLMKNWLPLLVLRKIKAIRLQA
jgi:hypothetical protein